MKKINKQISLGRTADGKRIRKWIHADTMADFNQQLFELKKQHEALRNPSDISFKDYSEAWLETYKSHKATNTYMMYARSVNKASGLRFLKIKDITRSDIQAVINKNIDHPRTCQQIALTLKQIFSSAVKDGIIIVNPAEDIELPKYKAKEKKALTERERTILKTVELKPQDRVFLDMLYYFGLRRGEALALTASDFDFKRLLLHINKSIAFNGNNPTIKSTKTQAVRYVPIPESLVPKLKAYLKNCTFNLFTTETGQLMTHSAYVKMWKRIEKAANAAAGGDDSLIAFKIKAHQIRHDYATRLYYVPGISTKKKAEILGHSERLFLELYSHLDSEKEDLEKFQKLMNF